MKGGAHTDYLLLRQRKRIARDVIHEGGNLTNFAEACGISLPGAIRYLEKHSPDIRRALKDNSRYAAHHPLKVLNRLRVISRTRKRQDAADKLGLSKYGLYRFIRDYCPDGVDEALAEYEAAYGAPLLEEAA